MYCLKCGQFNEDGVKFCQSCGTPLEQQPKAAEPETPSVTAAPGTCPECGYVNEPDVKFCQNCGKSLTGAVTETEPEKKEKTRVKKPGKSFDLKKLLIAAGAVVAVVLVIVVLSSLFKTGNYIVCKNAIFTYGADEEYLIGLADGKLCSFETDSYSYSVTTSLDGTKAVLYSYGSNELYYFDGSAVRSVAEDVESYEMSADGSAVIYNTEGDELYDLYIYSGGKSSMIASEVTGSCISPDGKIVGYIGDYNEETESFKGYLWDGSEKELGKNKVPLAASNGGKYIYYAKYSGDDEQATVYVQKGTNDDTKQKLGDLFSTSEFYLNSDGDQAMLVEYDKTYVSVKGGERIKVSGSACNPILPQNTQSCIGEMVTTLGIKSFADMYYSTSSNSGSGYKLLYVNKSFESSTAANNVDSYYALADDGKTLYYLKGDSIRRINASKSGSEAETLVEDDVSRFCISDNGKTIFFVTDEGELYSCRNGKKTKLLTDDLDSYSAYSLYGGDTIYYISDGELFSSTGDKSTKISGFSGDVTGVYCSHFGITVHCSDDGDINIYRSSDGKKYDLVVQE